MTLIVSIIAKDKENDKITWDLESEINFPHPGYNSFGFESWRGKVWGSKAVKDLGCKIIPTLHSNDIYAYDDDVALLKAELETILAHLVLIAETLEIEKEAIEIRVINALEGIKVVEKNIDKVGLALW